MIENQVHFKVLHCIEKTNCVHPVGVGCTMMMIYHRRTKHLQLKNYNNNIMFIDILLPSSFDAKHWFTKSQKIETTLTPLKKMWAIYYCCNFHSRIDLLCWPRKINNSNNVAETNSEIIAIIKEPIVIDVHCGPHAERAHQLYANLHNYFTCHNELYVRNNNNKTSAPNLHEHYPAPNSFMPHQTHNSRTFFLYRTR